MLEPNGNLSCEIGNQLFLSAGCFDDVDFPASVEELETKSRSHIYDLKVMSVRAFDPDVKAYCQSGVFLCDLQRKALRSEDTPNTFNVSHIKDQIRYTEIKRAALSAKIRKRTNRAN